MAIKIQGTTILDDNRNLLAANSVTTTGVINASTFNATSLTDGGFQGIAADTVTAPSFTWTGDLNTGMYAPAADTIGFTTGGAERVRIDSSGLTTVGSIILGTQTNKATITYTTNTARTYTLPDAGGAADFVMTAGTQTIAGAKTFSGDLTIADKIIHSGDTNTAIRFPAADTVTVETDDSERMRIDSNGNVGIGTTTPSEKLEVNGNIKIASNSSIYSDGDVNISADQDNNNAASAINFNVDGSEVADFNNTGYLRFNKTAFVGGGICNQQNEFALNLGGGSNSLNSGLNIALSGPGQVSASAGFVMRDGTATKSGWQRSSDTHYWLAAGSEKVRIDSTGLAIVSGVISSTAVSSRDKLRVWNSSAYSIGMQNSITFGSVSNDYAMTFQMDNTNNRGFWWGNSVHTTAQGAMSLSTQGHLSVASAIRVGYGESDTTKAGTNGGLDVKGNVLIESDVSTTLILSTFVGNANDSTFVLRKARGGVSGPTAISTGDDLGTISFQGYDGTVYSEGAFIRADSGSATGNFNGELIFGTNGGERVRIDEVGRVGIGTSSPLTALHVIGDTTTTGVTYRNQPEPVSKSASATLTIAELLTGIIQYTGSAATLTLPTGTNIEGGLPATSPTNMSFDFSVITTGAGTATLGTATGLTLVGNMGVAATTSSLFRVRKTGTNTFTVYRIG
jgi:hypothetical protein